MNVSFLTFCLFDHFPFCLQNFYIWYNVFRFRINIFLCCVHRCSSLFSMDPDLWIGKPGRLEKSKFTLLRQTYLEKHCNVPFTKSNCSNDVIQNNSHTRKPIHHMSRHVMDECTTTIRCANGCALTWNASLAVSLTALHRAACGTPGVRQASRLDTARSWLLTYG